MTPGLEIELDPQRWLGEANDLTSADLCRILSPSKKALLQKDYNLVQNIAVSRGKVSTIFSLFVETAKPWKKVSCLHFKCREKVAANDPFCTSIRIYLSWFHSWTFKTQTFFCSLSLETIGYLFPLIAWIISLLKRCLGLIAVMLFALKDHLVPV